MLNAHDLYIQVLPGYNFKHLLLLLFPFLEIQENIRFFHYLSLKNSDDSGKQIETVSCNCIRNKINSILCLNTPHFWSRENV